MCRWWICERLRSWRALLHPWCERFMRCERFLWCARVRWLFSLQLTWFSLYLLGASFVFAVQHRAGEGHGIRYWGLALQVLSIFVVVVELFGKGKMFEKTPCRTFSEWLRRYPRKTVAAEFALTTLLVGGASEGSVGRVYVKAGDSLASQVQMLRRHVARIDAEQVATARRLASETEARQDAMRVERAEVDKAVLGVHNRLEEATASNLHVSWFGVLWLLVGSVLATMAPEVAEFARWVVDHCAPIRGVVCHP